MTTAITAGSMPPKAHWKAMQILRERYALPAIITTADALPSQLTP
ncbi:hypothetical protein ACFPOI_33865 [Nonomuraea angiospora]|uniref:Uncharacterized protein n=1 Tax=Nonomuraea angiospora TaxID=46172 RepID=A0ABR9LT45_9ACTN|nr:hypothetical protein [Nonomuraea angiospora]MBE1583829.1 hypothetical protein [Nonomuraea angiospora]